MSVIKQRLGRKVTTGQTSSVNVYHLETDTDVVLVGDTGETLSEHIEAQDADRSITLTGDVSGTGTLQMGSNLEINTTVADDSHSHTGSTIAPGAANRVAISNATGELDVSDITTTELNALDGITGNIQTQLGGKSDDGHNHDTRYVKQTAVGAENGVAPLDSNGIIDSQYLPSYVDDVIEAYIVAGATALSAGWLTKTSGGEALTPETGKVYVVVQAGDYQNKTYRWGGSTYVTIASDLALGETASTAYRGDRGKAAYEHSLATHARVDATNVSSSESNGYIAVNGENMKVYEHPTTSGNKHLPSGGQQGDILAWQSDGTGKWETMPSITKGTTTGGGNAITDLSFNGHEVNITKGTTFLTEHPPITLDTDTTSAASPAHGGTFTAVSDVHRDDNGHVINIDVKTVTLPSETQLSKGTTPVADEGNVVTDVEVNNHQVTVRREVTAVLEGDARLTDARTPLSHAHGNISNDGKIATDTAIQTGDRMLIADVSAGGTVARSGVTFDGADTTKALTPKGTFETFLQASDIAGKADKSATVSNVSYASKKIQKTINGSTTDVVSATTLMGDMDAFGTGAKGLVPAPAAGDANKYLRGDGTWANVAEDTDTTYTFTGGQTNKFTVTPSNAAAQDVTINPEATITANATNDTGTDVTLAGTNGTNAVTYKATHKVYHNTAPGSKGPSADDTLAFGGTFTVPEVSVNKTGHVDDADEHTFTLPSETELSLGTAAGSGNAITSIAVNDHEITPTFGKTFVEEGDSRLSDARTPLSHTHGNLTNDGKVGSDSDMAIVTGTGGIVKAANLTTADVTATGNATSFVTAVTQDSKGKITATKSTVPTADGTTAGITKLYTGTGSNTDGAMSQAAVNSALAGKLNTTLKGAANGLAELDAEGKVPSSQLPSYVDDVIEVDDYAHLPETGEAGKIYVTKDDNKTYRWTGTVYAQIKGDLALGETSSTAYRGDYGKIAYDHSQDSKIHVPIAANAGKILKSAANAAPVWGDETQLSMGSTSGDGNAVTGVAVNNHQITLTMDKTFVEDDDERLSDARTPLSHVHGNIANDGTLTEKGVVVVTDATTGAVKGSAIDPSDIILEGDSRLTDARTPTSHAHGNVTNGGAITSDTAVANGDKLVIIDASGDSKLARAPITFDASTTTTALTPKGTFETFLQASDITGKADKSETVTNVAYDSTDKKITKTIDGTTTDVVTAATLKAAMALDSVENKSSATIRGELTKANVTTALGYTPPEQDTTYDEFAGSDPGLVPEATASDAAKFLRGDGSWASPAEDQDTTYTFADGTNSFTVTPKNGNPQTVNVTPSATITAGVTNAADTDVTLAGTNGTNGVTYQATHKTYYAEAPGAVGPNGNVSPAHGGTFTVPQVTVNTTGHVNAITGRTVTLPSETQLSLGTEIGNGNAITGIAVADHQITVTKGESFAKKSETVSGVTFDNTTKKVQKTIDGTTSDVLAFEAGDNVTLTATAGKLSISSTNTDTKVTQTLRTENSDYPVLLSGEASAATATGTRTASFGTSVTVNPSTGTLAATVFSGSGASLTNLPAASLTGTIDAGRLPDLSNTYATKAHAHGDITDDGKIGTTADYAVVTGTGGVLSAESLATESPTANGNTTSFIDTVSQNSKGKITATKKTIPTASGTVAGIAKMYTSTGDNADGGMTQAAITSALSGKVDSSLVGAVSGLATLDATGKVPSSQLPSYVDDVIEVDDYAHLPQTGESGKIYVTVDDNKTYRWSGTTYSQIKGDLALGVGTTDAYYGDKGKIAYDHSQDSTVHVPTTSVAGKILKSVANGAPVWGDETTLSHPHGNITYDGAITATGAALASGDALVFADSSDDSILKKTSITFDGTTDTQALTKKGTFETFLTSSAHTITVNSGTKKDGTTAITATSATATSPSVTLGDSGATAGAYGDSAAQTPSYGGTFKVPYVQVNAKGIVTDISEHTVKIPASDNVDTKVTQSSDTTTSSGIPVLMAYQASPTSGTASTAKYNGNVTITPSSGLLTASALSATTLNGATIGSSPQFTDTNYYHTAGSWSGLVYTLTGAGGASDISITLPTGTAATQVALGNHGHGNITNTGAITATGVALASGDALVFADSSDSSILKKTSITFDGSTTSQALTKAGTFATFLTSDGFSTHVQSGSTQPTNQSSGDLWFQTLS